MVQIDRFIITADSNCIILQEKKITENGKNKGEKRLENIGYYSNLGGAVFGVYKILSRESIAKSKIITIDEQIKKLEKIRQQLKEEMSGIKWES